MPLRIGLYLIFTLVAAPIDSVLLIWSGWVTPDRAQLVEPFADALLYIYAFVLSVETMFRVEQHHEILVSKIWLRLPQLIAFVVVCMFIIDYMNVVRPKVLHHQSVLDTMNRQIIWASLALLASFLSFIACESEKSSKITASPTKKLPSALGSGRR